MTTVTLDPGNTTSSRRQPRGGVVLSRAYAFGHDIGAPHDRPATLGSGLTAALSQGGKHQLHGLLGPLLHQRARQPQHPVAHATEVTVPPRIRPGAPLVHFAVHLDHELRLGRHEVRDVPAQHHLPPEAHAELPSPERLPEQRLGGGGRRAKGGGLSDDDNVRCAHDDLPSPAPWPGFGVPWRRGRDALARPMRLRRGCPRPERATRHRARRATCASQPQPGQGTGRRAERRRLALRSATVIRRTTMACSLGLETIMSVPALGATPAQPRRPAGSTPRPIHSSGGQPMCKRSQRSTYPELPHSPAGAKRVAAQPRSSQQRCRQALSAEDESGGARRRGGATPRAPAGGGIINDALRRPTHQYLKIGAAPETLLQRTLYGESAPTPEVNNLRGKPIRHYDEAGALKSESYDFKGNPLETQRRLALAFTAATDWTPLATATTPSAIDAAAAALLETETFTQTRSYDALNRIASATEPDLTEIKPSYNQRGLLDQVEARIRNAATWTTFVGDIQYDQKAQRQSIDYGNGTATAYQYDELTYRLLHLTTTRTSPSNTLQDLSYTFDPVGNIVAISDAAQQTLFYNNSVVLPQNLFEYDALYRLISATGREHASIGDVQLDHNDLPLQNLPHNNDASAVRTYLEEYAYDHVGNILEMFHEAAGTPVATWTRAYTYGVGTNRLATNTIPGGTATYTHDTHGNLLSMPHLASIDWTPFDQIKTCDLGGGGDVYFTYASDGTRVRKVWQQTTSAVKERIYLGAYEIYREKLSGVTQLERQTLHLMDGVQRIAMVETKTIEGGTPIATPVPKQRYQLGNHLGSAMLEVDETGLIISYEEYHPYGTSAYRSARSGVEVSARRYRYTGKERDDETGLYYYGARYYACWLARWTSADPLGIGADGPGLYNYTRGSPVVLVDPSGLEGATPPLAPRVGLSSPPPPKAEPDKAAPAKPARTTGPRPSSSSPAPAATATAEATVGRDPFSFAALMLHPSEHTFLGRAFQEALTDDRKLKTAQDVAAVVAIVGAAGATGGIAAEVALGAGLSTTAAGAFAGAASGSVELGAATAYEGRDPTRSEALEHVGGGALLGGVAARLGQWAAQFAKASAITSASAPEASTFSIRFTPQEEAIAQYLRQFGRKVEPNPLEGVAGAGRQGDALIDGLKHEFKTLEPGAGSNTIRNIINKSKKRGGQARNWVIDARGSGLSEAEARRGIGRAAGAYQEHIDRITVIGDKYFIGGP